jgi:hypothetical protein
MIELFLIPMIVVGTNRFGQPHKAPKYIHDDPNVIGYSAVRYSRVSEAIVAVEADQTTLNALAGESDVFRMADDSTIDNTINNGQRNSIRNFLEARDIPAQWVNTGDTRREIIRGLAGIFLFAQRVEGRTGEGLKESFQQAGISLDSTWSSLPQSAKDILTETADSFGWTNPGFTGSTTIREILIFMSQQFEGTPISIGGYDL